MNSLNTPMIRVLLLLASILSTLHVSAQLSRSLKGNEWIDYSKEYHKIQVGEDGIYSISNEELQAMGIDPSMDKSHIHVYNLGKEVRIIENADGLIFYGLKNRGQVDALGYEKDEDVLNPEYSIITDTAAYFLMVDDTKEALRYKSIEQDLQGNTLESSPYYLHEEKTVFSSFANKPNGAPTDYKVYYSSLLPGEGFSSTRNITFKQSLEVKNIYPNGPNTKVKLFWATNNTDNHLIEINVNEKLHRVDSSKYEEMSIDEIFVPSSEIDGKIPIEMKGTYSNNDRFSVALIETTFPRTFTYPQKNIWNLEIPHKSEPQYIELDGASSPLNILNHTTGERFLSTTSLSGKQGFLLPASDKNIHLTIYSSTTSSVYAGKRTFTDYSNKPNDYIIISHPSLIESLTPGTPMEQYVAYRKSEIGGGFDPIVIDINQLYDQYGYGVNRHFLAIRNFGKELKRTWSNPSYIFLIGKGINYHLGRKETPEIIGTNLVPTFGYPTSDNLLIPNEKENMQDYAIGRLAATESYTISDYLHKVKTYEAYSNLPQTLGDKKWLKDVFHLAGGEVRFDNYLKSLAEIIKSNKYGANVQSFGKAGSGNVDDSFFEKSYELLKNGVSIFTFMGHAGVNVLEANIDDPKNYENIDKYPLFFVLGCLAGDICTGSYGISEKFVNIKEKGSAAFVATTGESYPFDQYYFTSFVYNGMGDYQYGERLGEIIRTSMDSIAPTSESLGRESFMHQLLLNGDPALKVLSFEGADYTFDNTSMTTKPSLITVADEYAEFCFDVTNMGVYTDLEVLPIRMKLLTENGEVFLDSVYTDTIRSSTQNICFKVPMRDEKLIGKNKLFLEINPDKTIQEEPSASAYSNNTFTSTSGLEGYEFTVLGNGVIATYPYNYAIVDSTTVDLIATTYNAFAPPSNYIYELDTLPDFSSPFKQKITLESRRSPISWTVNIPDVTERVYYWRVAPDTIVNGERTPALWDQHSFTYVKDGEEGWSQSHWGQYAENDFVDITINNNDGFQFGPWDRNFVIENNLNGEISFVRDGTLMDSWRKTAKSGIGLIVMDSLSSFLERNNKTGKYNSLVTPHRTFFYEYPMESLEDRKKLYDVLNSDQFDGKIVLGTTLQQPENNLDPLNWVNDANEINTGFKEIFEAMGSASMDVFYSELNSSFSFLFNGSSKKLIKEYISTNANSVFNSSYRAIQYQGLIETVLIGPSGRFDHLEVSIDYQDQSYTAGKDSIAVAIYGVDVDNAENLLYDFKQKYNYDFSDINTDQYIYLKAKIRFYDPFNHDIPHIKYIRSTLTPYPDIVLKVDTLLTSTEYKLNQKLNIPVTIKTFSSEDISSLFDLNYKLKTSSDENSITKGFDGLKRDEEKKLYIPIEMKNPGDYTLEIDINRNKNVIEQTYLNNYGSLKVKVEDNNVADELNVTFDGKEIFNNEIVSAKPKIEIQLRKPKEAEIISDRKSLEIYLGNESNNFEKIDISDPRISIIEDSKDVFKILFEPVGLIDGSYTLKVIRRLQETDYLKDFRIITVESIGNIYNYPNPFSSQTRFFFTLTGSSLPSSMIIRIYTTSGKVVREITSDQLGPLKIGLNKSKLVWDGTDDYGEKLANGVYFYKVITKDSSHKDYLKLKEGNDKHYAKHNVGKLVILR